MSVFEETTETNQSAVEALVGEGKKFKTLEDLAKGKLESDKYIEELTAKVTSLEASTAEQDHAKSLLEKIEEMGKAQESTPPAQQVESNKEDATLSSEDELKRLVAEELERKSKETIAERNRAAADAAMRAKFGDKAQEQLKSVASNMGLSVEFLKSTAETSPDAFAKLVGLDAVKTNTSSAPVTETRSEGMSTTTGTKDWAYYTKMRKENPTAYRSPAIQAEIIAELEKQGSSAFYNK